MMGKVQDWITSMEPRYLVDKYGREANGCILRYRKMISMISRCGGYGDIGVLWETGSRLTRRTAI